MESCGKVASFRTPGRRRTWVVRESGKLAPSPWPSAVCRVCPGIGHALEFGLLELAVERVARDPEEQRRLALVAVRAAHRLRDGPGFEFVEADREYARFAQAVAGSRGIPPAQPCAHVVHADRRVAAGQRDRDPLDEVLEFADVARE